MKIIAFVIETPSVRAILEHIGEPTRPPVISSARHSPKFHPNELPVSLLAAFFRWYRYRHTRCGAVESPILIKGYVPGVRENGGQYTHGAIWAAMAFAALGDNRRAWELATMINPANHAKSWDGIETYKVEPYVMAADVYALAPHTGRGGWTWYTGSAGWMYRLIVESLLGVRLDVDRLSVAPCLPAHWDGLKIHYRFRETVYHIHIVQTHAGEHGTRGERRVTVDGVEQDTVAIALVDDRREHTVEVSVKTH